MCGRFVQPPISALLPPELVHLAPALAELPANFNLAPTQLASVVLCRHAGIEVATLSWGLLPHWAQARGLQRSTINARVETVATKPVFRAAFEARRCLVPMSGYYEWTVNDVDGKKDPWYISADDQLWAAGLWEGPSPLLAGDNQGTFTVITGQSSGVSADVHDRMPLFLGGALLEQWLASGPDQAMAMLLAAEPPPLTAYRVARAVNTPRNNNAQLLQPAA